MPIYNPNIPQPTDDPSDSQDQLLQNFQTLNNSFSVNHKPFTDTSAQAGYHTEIFFPGAVVDPNLPSPASSIYTKLVSGINQLFFQNGNMAANITQLTGITVASSANGGTAGGTIFTLATPWGITLYFGTTSTLSSSTPRTVIFPTPYSTIYLGMCTATDPNGLAVGTIKSTTQLSLKSSEAAAAADFLAIGKI